jgi:hypothetical protein
MSRLAVLLLAFALACCAAPSSQTWRPALLRNVTAEGGPERIATPYGPGLRFDGVDDVLFLKIHPLAGARTFTIEAFIRPDGGKKEQRWLHLAQAEKATEASTGREIEPRIMFEIRTENGAWWLDSFALGPAYRHTLIFPEKRHAVGEWAHVAQTFDGRFYRAYVNGVLEGEAELAFTPQGPGRTAIGARMNRVDYFQGAIATIRFTQRALRPQEFLRAH